jgi:hypothetical protein
VSAYIPVEPQRQVRAHFRNCCAYCRTAEALTVAIFEFEHRCCVEKCDRTILLEVHFPKAEAALVCDRILSLQLTFFPSTGTRRIPY